MLFGDKNFFAIEAVVSDEIISGYIYCKFRFWARNIPVGNFEEIEKLLLIVSNLQLYLKDSVNNRQEVALDDLSSVEVFDLLFNSVFITIPKNTRIMDTKIEPRKEPQFDKIRQRFILDDIGGDSFMDYFNIVMFDKSDGYQRLIWRNLDEEEIIQEVLLLPNTFESVSKNFLDWATLILKPVPT